MIGSDLKKVSGDEYVEEIMENIQRGIKRRRREEERWEDNETFEDMAQWNGKKGVEDQATINKLGAYVENYGAQVAFNNPRMKASPKTSDGWEPIQVPVAGPDGKPKLDESGRVVVREVILAKARESLVNTILSAPKQHLLQTSVMLTKAGVLGLGYLKCGYDPILEDIPEEEDQMIPVKDGKLDFSAYETDLEGGLIENDGRLVDRRDTPVWEDFWIRWVPYRHMIIDPEGGNYWDDHRWVAEEEIKHIDDVKANRLFKNTKDLNPSGTLGGDGTPKMRVDPEGSDWSKPGTEEPGEDCELIRIFHYYDLIRRRYVVVADGSGKALRDVSWDEIDITDHPYSDFRPAQIPGEFYPRPRATDLAPINRQYNWLSQLEIREADRSTRKVFVRKGRLDPAARRALRSSEDMEIVEIDIPNTTPMSEAIVAFQAPPGNGAIQYAKQQTANDFAEIGGMTDEARGKASADSATQVSVMEQYSGLRVDRDRKILAECWRLIFKKLNDLIDTHMTTARAVQLIGTDGQAFQGLVDPGLVAGDFDIEVDFQDMAPPNTAMQNAGKVQILQMMPQAPEQFDSDAKVRTWCEPYGIKDQNFIDDVVKGAEWRKQLMMMQAMGVGAAPGARPEAGAPGSESQALSQSAAGTQIPRQSGRP